MFLAHASFMKIIANHNFLFEAPFPSHGFLRSKGNLVDYICKTMEYS